MNATHWYYKAEELVVQLLKVPADVLPRNQIERYVMSAFPLLSEFELIHLLDDYSIAY